MLGLSTELTLPEIPGLIIFLTHSRKGEDFDLDLGFLAASPNLEVIQGSKFRGSVRGFNPPKTAKSLTCFSMSLADPSDFDIIAKYPSLTELAVPSTDIRDLSAIPQGTKLERLDLSGTGISDIRKLTEINHLTEVDISDTFVDDIAPLSFCKNLERISAAKTKIASLHGWNPGARLRSLDVSDTGFSDLQPLVGTYLSQLSARRTPLSNLSGLSGIRWLSRLNISGTKVADIPQTEVHAAIFHLDDDPSDYRDRGWFEFRDTPLEASGFKPQFCLLSVPALGTDAPQSRSGTDKREKRRIWWKRLFGL